MMKPNDRGAGIMLSDFVEEKVGFHALTESEYQGAKTTRPSIKTICTRISRIWGK